MGTGAAEGRGAEEISIADVTGEALMASDPVVSVAVPPVVTLSMEHRVER